MKRKHLIFGLIILVFLIIIYFAFNRFIYLGELIKIDGIGTYHRDNCPLVKKANLDKLKIYPSLLDTAWKGLRPCKTCHPTTNILQVKAVEKLMYQRKLEDKQKYLNGELDLKVVKTMQDDLINNNLLSKEDLEKGKAIYVVANLTKWKQQYVNGDFFEKMKDNLSGSLGFANFMSYRRTNFEKSLLKYNLITQNEVDSMNTKYPITIYDFTAPTDYLGSMSLFD